VNCIANSRRQACNEKGPGRSALHVGCYGEGPFIDAVPESFNGSYDPRVALQAFQYYFPTTPLYVGLRVGPPDNGGYRRTLAELTDYTNNVVMRNAAGVFCYAAEWPFDDPTGDVGPTCPDSNMVTYMVGAGRSQSPSDQQHRPPRRAVIGVALSERFAEWDQLTLSGTAKLGGLRSFRFRKPRQRLQTSIQVRH